jgi:AbrB family looped-hinge helix DNA binding protein
MTIVKSSAKGQVVIPREIRKALGIVPGARFDVRVEGKEIVLFPLPGDPVRALRGILKGGPSMTKALLEDRRAEYEREEKKAARLVRRARLAAGRGRR